MKRTFTTREVIPAEDDLLLYDLKLRKADQDELEAASGLSAKAALVSSVADCVGKVWLSSCDGQPFMVSGVEPSPFKPGEGTIWAVGTDLITGGGIDIIRWAKGHVASMGEGFTKLSNFMDRRNVVHRRYVESLGFTFTGREVYFGPHVFDYFEKSIRRDNDRI